MDASSTRSKTPPDAARTEQGRGEAFSMDVTVSNQQTRLPVDEARLVEAAARVLADAGYARGELSIAVVDDPTIHELNRRHLAHDYPTDVLSFALEEQSDLLEGEVIVSADTAIRNAREYGWRAEDELLLYLIHGSLHLVGLRDKSDDEALAMRRAEAEHLRRCGVEPPRPAAEPRPRRARQEGAPNR